MKFYSTVYISVPGNFVDFWLRNPVQINNEPIPSIPQNYTLDNKEIIRETLTSLGLEIRQFNPFTYPKIIGEDIIKNAVFEIDKTASRKFRVIRYVGNLNSTTTYRIEPVTVNIETNVNKSKQGSDSTTKSNRFSEIDFVME
jgi:hypothetical protein